MSKIVSPNKEYWIVQVHCVEDSHLTTLLYETLNKANVSITMIRRDGLIVQDDDNPEEYCAWPPHLLGCFNIYKGVPEDGMAAPLTDEEVRSMI